MGNSGICTTTISAEQGFDDRFEVDEVSPLGSGKFSVVYLCWERQQPQQRYALKVISTAQDDHAALTRIYEEINILKVLGSHPSIIQLVDMDETALNQIRLVLELCGGGELYDRIQSKKFFPEHEAKLLVRNLLQALAFIHSRGIMHRDLKPENILMVSKVSHTDIKVSDFGLARLAADYPRRLPRSNSICGSDFYLAPELIRQEEYGREIDIWSSGVVTYVVLSGSLPFFNSVLHKLYRQIVEVDVSFPGPSWQHVSNGAQDFILRLLQAKPGNRLSAEQASNHPWLRSAAVAGTGFAGSASARSGSASHRSINPTDFGETSHGAMRHIGGVTGLAPAGFHR